MLKIHNSSIDRSEFCSVLLSIVRNIELLLRLLILLKETKSFYLLYVVYFFPLSIACVFLEEKI